MKRYRFPFTGMGSPCTLNFYAETSGAAEAVLNAIIAEVERIESRYSRYRSDSLLSRLNLEAHEAQGFKLDAEFAGLINYANTCFLESEGLFDISSGVLRKAWTFSKGQSLPNQQLIDQLLPSIGFQSIRHDDAHIFFTLPGMEIDLGGIVKEYAADCAANILRQMGIDFGVVNFGGDLRIVGPHPDGTPWEIGIHHPRRPDTLIASLNLTDGAVTTSGDYERAFFINGKRYSHLLNPKTGWPVEGLQCVSVIAPLAVIAGSASTIAMLKGYEGKSWLQDMGLPCLWVDDEGRVGQLGIAN